MIKLRCALPISAKKLDSVQGNSHWMTSPATASQLNASFETLRERIQAERALREIRPADLLRAAMWGMGEQFPQLSAHELIDTSRRYLIAQDRFERSSLQLACVSRTLEPSLVGRNTHTGKNDGGLSPRSLPKSRQAAEGVWSTSHLEMS